MTDKPDNPFKFWEELKRRKVIRVIIGYLASAYVLLELTSIVAEPLGLPGWTINLVLVLLVIGFIITALISWIYDLTPGGIKKTESAKTIKGKPEAIPVNRVFRISNIVIAALIIVVGILAYPKVFKKDKFENIRDDDGGISIAVMPFKNMTGDASLDYFQRGLSSIITSGLSESSELTVCDDQTMFELTENNDQINYAGFSPAMAKEIAKKVRSKTYITGSYQGRESDYLILANLVDAESGNIIWTGKIKGNLNSNEYLDLADYLANDLKNYLEIQALVNDVDFDFRNAFPKSSEAYRYYIEGLSSIMSSDYTSAHESLDKALSIDSTFTFAAFYKAFAYNVQPNQDYENMVRWTGKAYGMRENLPPVYRNWLSMWHTTYFSKDGEELKRYCNLLGEAEIESRLFWFDLGTTYSSILKDYEKAVRAFGVIDEIDTQRERPWEYIRYYHEYGKALIKVGNYIKAQEVFESGLNFAATNYWQREMYFNLIIIALIEGKDFDAYMEKYLALKREIGQSQFTIEADLSTLYLEAGLTTEAVEHARKANQLDPSRVLNLAIKLIEADINIEEGLELMTKLLERYPGEEILYYWKAKACYKLENYEESLSLVDKAIDINQVYFHDAIMLKKEIEQALARQKSEQ